MTREPMAPWLLAHLERLGHIGPDGLSAKCRYRRCDQCGQPTLIGLAGVRPMIPACADPVPLNPLGEAMALVGGRPTYARWIAGGRIELHPRTSFAITRSPAGTDKHYDVVAGHACGLRTPAEHIAPTNHRQPTIAPKETDACPF